MSDPFDLSRFVLAQDTGGTYQQALQELRDGRKRSHWMWFIFPQVAGLGQSPMARRYAIASLPEAAGYLQHRVLGSRLLECVAAVNRIQGRSAVEIFSSIDAQKLRSCMTLFLRADPTERAFQQVLDRYFDSVPDAATDRLL